MPDFRAEYPASFFLQREFNIFPPEFGAEIRDRPSSRQERKREQELRKQRKAVQKERQLGKDSYINGNYFEIIKIIFSLKRNIIMNNLLARVF